MPWFSGEVEAIWQAMWIPEEAAGVTTRAQADKEKMPVKSSNVPDLKQVQVVIDKIKEAQTKDSECVQELEKDGTHKTTRVGHAYQYVA
jgi:hypothetical protein